ncbi:MAG: hypothetical protein JXI43_10375 [Tissierellales bacterium]|nr:hypothetical protein [Tissierellales bacterium]
MDFSVEDKVKILLQQEKNAVDQLMEIKRDEMSWLRVFLLFYSAIVVWSVQRWLGHDQAATEMVNDLLVKRESSLIYATLFFSYFATFIFSFLFIRTRWSYYGVANRLIAAQELLQLYNAECWNGENPLKPINKINQTKNYSEWMKYTKPMSSFFTRLIYLIGANLTIMFIASYALKWLSGDLTPYFYVTWILANLILLMSVFIIDFIHFVTKSK